jgi:hypothetical protein
MDRCADSEVQGDEVTARGNVETISEALLDAGLRVKVSRDGDGGWMAMVTRGQPGRYAAAACDDDGDVHLIIEEPPAMPHVEKMSAADAATALIGWAVTP